MKERGTGMDGRERRRKRAYGEEAALDQSSNIVRSLLSMRFEQYSEREWMAVSEEVRG